MWEYFLMPFLSSLFGTGNALFGNSLAQGRESQARRENYLYGEKAAENADKRTRALYNDLQSPQAMMQQIQDAGLSPSLMYSSGGVGGSTPAGAQGGGASGISPNMYTIDAMQLAEMQKTQAETKLIEAQEKNVEKRNETEAERGQAELQKLLTDAGLTEAQTTLTNSQNTFQELQNKITEATTNSQINAALHEAKKLQYEEIKMLWDAENSKIDYETKQKLQEAVIKESNARAANILADTALKQSNTNLNNEQKKKLIAEVEAIYTNAAVALKNADTQARQAKNSEIANKIRNEELKKQVEMFNAELKLKYKEYNLQVTDTEYKYGERHLRHIGSMNMIATQSNDVTPIHINR